MAPRAGAPVLGSTCTWLRRSVMAVLHAALMARSWDQGADYLVMGLGRVTHVTCKRCGFRVALSVATAGLCGCGALGSPDGVASEVGHHDLVAIAAVAAEHFEGPHLPHVEAVQLPDPEYGAYPAAASAPVPGVIRARRPSIPYVPRSRISGPPIVPPPVVPQTIRRPHPVIRYPSRSRVFGPPLITT